MTYKMVTKDLRDRFIGQSENVWVPERQSETPVKRLAMSYGGSSPFIRRDAFSDLW